MADKSIIRTISSTALGAGVCALTLLAGVQQAQAAPAAQDDDPVIVGVSRLVDAVDLSRSEVDSSTVCFILDSSVRARVLLSDGYYNAVAPASVLAQQQSALETDSLEFSRTVCSPAGGAPGPKGPSSGGDGIWYPVDPWSHSFDSATAGIRGEVAIGVDQVARVEQVLRVEDALDLLEQADRRGRVHPGQQLGPLGDKG